MTWCLAAHGEENFLHPGIPQLRPHVKHIVTLRPLFIGSKSEVAVEILKNDRRARIICTPSKPWAVLMSRP